MSQELIMDAIGYLDTDILAEHLRQKERLRNKFKKGISIWKLSAVAACICVVIVASTVVIPLLSETSTADPPTIDFNFFDGLAAMDEMPTVLRYYACYEYSSFVKIENIEFCEGLYSWSPGGSQKFYMIKGIVIEDYYEKIGEGTAITIPIIATNPTFTEDGAVDHSRVYVEEELSEFIQQFDTLYVYLDSGMYYQQSVYSLEYGNTEHVGSLMCTANIPQYTIIPAQDGRICMNQLDEFCQSTDTSLLYHSDIVGFDRVIYDGQEEVEFEDNIKNIYQYLTSNGE